MPSVVALSNGAPGHEVLLEGAVLLRMFREPRAEVVPLLLWLAPSGPAPWQRDALEVVGKRDEALLNAGPDGGSVAWISAAPSRWSLPSGVRPVGRLRGYEGGESVGWRWVERVEVKKWLLSSRCLTEGPPHRSRIGNLRELRIHDERHEEA